MTTQNDTPQGGGEAARTNESQQAAQPAPRSDAEAAQQEAARQAAEAGQQQPPAQQQPKPEGAQGQDEERKRNRTRDYINRINGENAELRRQLAERQSGTAQQQGAQHPQQPQRLEVGPQLADFGYDFNAYQPARDAWLLEQAQKQFSQQHQQRTEQIRQQETWTAYNTRAAEFAVDHPDFAEVAGSIAYPLDQAVQAAIAAHPQGPAIAYHLGNNEDDAYALASTQPHLAAAAVQRIAARMSAAPAAASGAPTNQAIAPAPTQPQRAVSQAPAPAPTVSGRAPAEVPPEKMTDEDWYAKDVERRRKR